MVVRAWPQKERRAEYESAAWQPEPELAARPRSVSFATAFKLGGAFGLLVIGVTVALVCLPSLKHAYVTLFGISTQATIQQRSERATGSGRKTAERLLSRCPIRNIFGRSIRTHRNQPELL